MGIEEREHARFAACGIEKLVKTRECEASGGLKYANDEDTVFR